MYALRCWVILQLDRYVVESLKELLAWVCGCAMRSEEGLGQRAKVALRIRLIFLANLLDGVGFMDHILQWGVEVAREERFETQQTIF